MDQLKQFFENDNTNVEVQVRKLIKELREENKKLYQENNFLKGMIKFYKDNQ